MVVQVRSLNAYKLERGCKVCGFREHPVALDFHHRDPKEKKFNIGATLTSGRSLATLKKEVAKCDVICANHHRMQWGMLDSYKGITPVS